MGDSEEQEKQVPAQIVDPREAEQGSKDAGTLSKDVGLAPDPAAGTITS
jgi:hypothetical protein